MMTTFHVNLPSLRHRTDAELPPTSANDAANKAELDALYWSEPEDHLRGRL